MTIAEVFVVSYRWTDIALTGKIFGRFSRSPIDGYRWEEATKVVGESQTMSSPKHSVLIESYSKSEQGLKPQHSLLAIARRFADTELQDAYLSLTE